MRFPVRFPLWGNEVITSGWLFPIQGTWWNPRESPGCQFQGVETKWKPHSGFPEMETTGKTTDVTIPRVSSRFSFLGNRFFHLVRGTNLLFFGCVKIKKVSVFYLFSDIYMDTINPSRILREQVLFNIWFLHTAPPGESQFPCYFQSNSHLLLR